MSDVAAVVTGKRMEFRAALLKAAREQQQAGELTRGDYVRIWFASILPNQLTKMQEFTTEQAKMAGKMPLEASPVGFDWTALLDFIKQLLPLILEIIALFK